MYQLPEKKDFMHGGRFYKLQMSRNRMPVELLSYIFPDYTEIMFKQKPPPKKKTLHMIYEYCNSLQKTVKKEEMEHKRKNKKEMEIKMLEENMKEYFNNYYKSLYSHCTCSKEKIHS
jgi:hypothetical protein